MTLVPLIEAYLRRTGMSATRFGRVVARDPRLVFDLREGREPRRFLYMRIISEIESGSRN